MATTRRRTKIPVRTLEKRSQGAYAALSEAVDALAVAERRERELAAGEELNREELENTYPGLRRTR